MLPVHAYPPSRGVAEAPRGVIAEQFHRYEASPAEVVTAATDTTILTCSGRPNMLRLSARTNGALFTLTDRLAREASFVAVVAGDSLAIRIDRDVILARDLVGGSHASVFVEAYYAAPAELGAGREIHR